MGAISVHQNGSGAGGEGAATTHGSPAFVKKPAPLRRVAQLLSGAPPLRSGGGGERSEPEGAEPVRGCRRTRDFPIFGFSERRHTPPPPCFAWSPSPAPQGRINAVGICP